MSEPVKLRDAHEKFQEFLKTKKRASATILAYGKDIDQLISFLQEINKSHIHDVTSDDIQGFLTQLKSKGYTPKSLSRKLNSTRTFYRYLKMTRLLSFNTQNMNLILHEFSLLLNIERLEMQPQQIQEFMR